MLNQISWSLWSLGQAFRSIGRERVWIPFAVFCGIQVFVLLVLANFYIWPVSLVLVPVLRSALGEAAVHYPFNLLAMPLVWTRLALVLDLLLLGVVIGWTYALLVRSGEAGGGARLVWRRWWAFALARLPFEVALVAVLILLPKWLVGGEEGLGGNSLRVFRVVTMGIAVGLEALFLLVPLFLLRDSMLRSLRDGIGFFLKFPVAMYLLVAIPSLAHVPLIWLLGRSSYLANHLAPEIVGWLLFLNIIVSGLAGYLSTVGAGRLHGVVRRAGV
jgi:hypothetical protein